MDQHPVPQNISSYEFRLVGDMTLKQFLQLAGGAGVGVIIYRLPLPGFLKWPLVIVAAGTGALMAFVPIQGRPFTQWLLAFIKAVYAPTEFFWNPMTTSPLPPIPTPQPSFISPPVSPKPTETPVLAQPLSPAEVAAFSTSTLPLSSSSTLNTTQYAKASALPLPSAALAKEGPPQPAPTPPPISSPKPTTYNPPPPTNLGPSPLTPSIHITHTPSSTGPTTTSHLPPPSLPNILTGLVVSSQNQPQEGAILEIVADATGLPVRALRTNTAGTFQIATPLPDGTYSLYTDKDGLSFDPISLTATGQVIQPIIIKAK